MTDCPNGEQRDLAQLYLAGRLPEDEAKAFEAHYFACERCAQDVEEGCELRAALGRPAVAPAAREVRSTPTWLPFAAAAAIAFVGVGVWLGRRAPVEPAPPVVRSAVAASLEVRVEAGSQGKLHLAWPSHPDAATYVVRVLSPDGTEVWKSEVREPRLDLDPAVLPAPPAGASFLIEVEALDAMRRVVAESEPSPLSRP